MSRIPTIYLETSLPLSLEKSGFRSDDIFHLHKKYDRLKKTIPHS